MRTNLPVTQKEFVIPDGVTLVSTTDLTSRITYCNPNFVSVSGYSREELLGQPHNLVRHPDMPAEAFRDMWATLQSGSPWSALVKNRRKNGDHYWVMANATPMLENGQVTGYMSVRTKPTRIRSREPKRSMPACAPKPKAATRRWSCAVASCAWRAGGAACATWSSRPWAASSR